MPLYGSDWGSCHNYLPGNVSKPVLQPCKGSSAHSKATHLGWLPTNSSWEVGQVAHVQRPQEEGSLAFWSSRGQQNPRFCSTNAGRHVFLITLLFVKAAREPRNCGSLFPLSFIF